MVRIQYQLRGQRFYFKSKHVSQVIISKVSYNAIVFYTFPPYKEERRVQIYTSIDGLHEYLFIESMSAGQVVRLQIIISRGFRCDWIVSVQLIQLETAYHIHIFFPLFIVNVSTKHL